MSSTDLIAELRAARPTAGEALREHVRSLAAAPVPARRRRAPAWWRPRRMALVAVPALGALAVATAGAIGLVRPAGQPESLPAAAEAQFSRQGATESRSSDATAGATAESTAPKAAPGPTEGRAQRYAATLVLAVADGDALSAATQQALQTTRSLGGFVVSVDYASGETGVATMTLRVPTGRAQDAVVRLSALGRIVSQDVRIDDLQESIDSANRRIVALRGQIARLTARLAAAGLDTGTRATLQARRDAARDELAALRATRDAAAAEARLATIQLTLQTEQDSVVPAVPSRLDRALDRAGAILAWEAAGALYALVVVGPLALLGLAGWLVHRAVRRREEQRLLAAR